MRGILLSDCPQEDAVDLGYIGIRRCRGCVKCLTERKGVCHIEDRFSEIIPNILASDDLTVVVHPVDGRVPSSVMKAVERISNVLEAYTASGGNEPLPEDSLGLRRVLFAVHGDLDRKAFESDMAGAMEKGPVTVAFDYR